MSRRRLPKRWICSGWRATSRATRRPPFSTGGRVSRHSALGDRLSLSSSLATIGVLASDHWTLVQPAGLHPLEGLRCCEEAIALARDIGWRPGQVFAQIIRLSCLTYVGDYARALEAIDCLALAEELEHRQW